MHVTLIDDLDGKPIEEGEGSTVTFSLQGIDYEIDLRTANLMKFEKAMEKYINAATRVGGRKRTKKAKGTTRAEALREVREWAWSQGYELSSKGRVPQHIMDAFAEAK